MENIPEKRDLFQNPVQRYNIFLNYARKFLEFFRV